MNSLIGFLLLLLSLNSFATTVKNGQLGCLLGPSMDVDVASQVPGVVHAVYVDRGSKVKKGDVLFLLETDVEKTELDLAKVKSEFVARKADRNKDLIEKKLLSEFERDEIVTEKHIAALEAREAQARLKQRSVYSPINGVVVERSINPGEYVTSNPVLKLVQLNPLYAELVMHADSYGSIKEGMEAEVIIEVPETKAFPGIVKIVDQFLDAASGTFGVRVEVQNPDFKVPAGLKCRVNFPKLNNASVESDSSPKL